VNTHGLGSDQFAGARLAHISQAASIIGLRPDDAFSEQQLAHLAWHAAVVEPCELLALVNRLPFRPPLAQPCQQTHHPDLDQLDAVLPLPHPLDYEWRYTPATRVLLMDRCFQFTNLDDPIALLGTPTLASVLNRRFRHLLLIDSNAETLAALRRHGYLVGTTVVSADLASWRCPTSWQHQARVVVCDAPWYPEAFTVFLRAAATLLRAGGTVLLSVPDALVRPSAASELNLVARLATALGFTITSVEPLLLRYRTPFFEWCAQRAAGVRVVPFDWRAGTLWQLTLRATSPREHIGDQHPMCPAGLSSPPVVDVVIGRARIRLCLTKPEQPGKLAVRSVVSGDVLPTVSRRHPARQQASVWTTGNHALGSPDPAILASVLTAAVRYGAWSSPPRPGCELRRDIARRHLVPLEDVVTTLGRISAVLDAELVELGAYQALLAQHAGAVVL
jgi:hypothetical protein